jgi:EAL domain-containing protein (putative c-di-GMP-specific phosphodiesterase class I)
VTVAEGVEDEAIQRLMVDLGFDLLPGFHLARPMARKGNFLQWKVSRRRHRDGDDGSDHRAAGIPPLGYG